MVLHGQNQQYYLLLVTLLYITSLNVMAILEGDKSTGFSLVCFLSALR